MSQLKVFLRQVVCKPREVVALAPSSRALSMRMAESVPEGSGNVIELGAGTGKITQALIDAGVPIEAIHSFEINSAFIEEMNKQYSNLNIYQDYAENIDKHNILDVKAVVSGLPLLSMDVEIQRKIVGGSFRLLRPGGLFIQFTYGSLPPIRKLVRDEFSLNWTRSEKIWGNMPPATSYVFYRRKVA